jgi:hypothetical protein
MRVHQNQVNPYAQLDAMHAAQKAAARRQAERTRKKLLQLASESAGEADTESCVVQLESHSQQQEAAEEKNQRGSRSSKKRASEIDSPDEHTSISDWV